MKRQTIFVCLAALRFTALLLVLPAVVTGLTGCGGCAAQATAIKLAKTEGFVG